MLLVSSEVPEVLGLADRVLVMREGRLVREAPADELDEDTVLDLVMAGSLLDGADLASTAPKGPQHEHRDHTVRRPGGAEQAAAAAGRAGGSGTAPTPPSATSAWSACWSCC